MLVTAYYQLQKLAYESGDNEVTLHAFRMNLFYFHSEF
jgi:hypothetical protein